MASPPTLPLTRITDTNGAPQAGALLDCLLTGTTTPASVYTDSTLSTAHANPVVADAGGMLPAIFLDPDKTYRFRARTAGGANISGMDFDPVSIASAATLNFTASGGVQRTISDKLGEFVSVKDFGAKGDNSTDDREAIQAAMDSLGDAGGTVLVPTGTYLVSKDPSRSIALGIPSNVTLLGEGTGSVIKRFDDDGGYHVLNTEDTENVAILNLTVDGNREAVATSGHGIRSATCTGLLIHNVLVRQCYSYGIGLQDGIITDCVINNVRIYDTGADGIDIKNKGTGDLDYDGGTIAFAIGDTVTGATSGASGVVLSLTGNTTAGTLTLEHLFVDADETVVSFIDNENLQVDGVTNALCNGELDRPDNSNILFSNIIVRRWGLRVDKTVQAGIDTRGPVRSVNIAIAEPGANDCRGYRARPGETDETNGFGGHYGSLTNFDIDMGDATGSTGVSLEARNCKAVSGRVKGGLTGIAAFDTGIGISDATVHDVSGNGVWLRSLSADQTANKAMVKGVRTLTCGLAGFNIEASNCELHACGAEGNTGYGLDIASTANKTRVFGGLVTGNTAGNIRDLGTNSRFAGTADYEQTYTVAQLATALTSPVKGQRAFVTDATVTTFASTVAGGGANNVPVVFNGTAWIVG